MLIDTSGFLCLHHRAEHQHADAVTLFDAASFRLTHSYVLAEFVALAYSRGLPRRESLSFVADIQDDPEIEVVYVDERLHRDALKLLQRWLDKTWTLCDAVSFLLMQEYRITEALTTDHHFEQAGFIRLLKP
jgi:predicted nucleic acid-binding protein